MMKWNTVWLYLWRSTCTNERLKWMSHIQLNQLLHYRHSIILVHTQMKLLTSYSFQQGKQPECNNQMPSIWWAIKITCNIKQWGLVPN